MIFFCIASKVSYWHLEQNAYHISLDPPIYTDTAAQHVGTERGHVFIAPNPSRGPNEVWDSLCWSYNIFSVINERFGRGKNTWILNMCEPPFFNVENQRGKINIPIRANVWTWYFFFPVVLCILQKLDTFLSWHFIWSCDGDTSGISMDFEDFHIFCTCQGIISWYTKKIKTQYLNQKGYKSCLYYHRVQYFVI